MRYQNRYLAILVGLLVWFSAVNCDADGNNFIEVSGTVIDADTKEPLAYATISVAKNKIGTISNLAGEFLLNVPLTYINDKVTVSMLGYANFIISIPDLLDEKNIIIELQPGHLLLNEVTISETLTAEDLLKIAISRIELNYPMHPVEMDGFYRETKQVNEEYVDLLEAAVKIYDRDYKAPKDSRKIRERVSLIEVRRAIEFDYSLQKFFSKYNILEDLLLENFVKYRTFSDEEEFYSYLKRSKVVGYNNESINLISLIQAGYELRIYIDKNYGIRKIIFNWGDGNTPLYSYRKSRNLAMNVVNVKKEIEFQEIEGKLYLKYIAANYYNQWVDSKSGEGELSTAIEQMLLINKVEHENPSWIPNSEKMKRYGLHFQHNAYNREFWKNYNIITEMPLNSDAVFDLEKLYTLEEQFESFN